MKKKFLFSTTLIIITAFLYQNIVWAYGNPSNLSPETELDDNKFQAVFQSVSSCISQMNTICDTPVEHLTKDKLFRLKNSFIDLFQAHGEIFKESHYRENLSIAYHPKNDCFYLFSKNPRPGKAVIYRISTKTFADTNNDIIINKNISPFYTADKIGRFNVEIFADNDTIRQNLIICTENYTKFIIGKKPPGQAVKTAAALTTLIALIGSWLGNPIGDIVKKAGADELRAPAGIAGPAVAGSGFNENKWTALLERIKQLEIERQRQQTGLNLIAGVRHDSGTGTTGTLVAGNDSLGGQLHTRYDAGNLSGILSGYGDLGMRGTLRYYGSLRAGRLSANPSPDTPDAFYFGSFGLTALSPDDLLSAGIGPFYQDLGGALEGGYDWGILIDGQYTHIFRISNKGRLKLGADIRVPITIGLDEDNVDTSLSQGEIDRTYMLLVGDISVIGGTAVFTTRLNGGTLRLELRAEAGGLESSLDSKLPNNRFGVVSGEAGYELAGSGLAGSLRVLRLSPSEGSPTSLLGAELSYPIGPVTLQGGAMMDTGGNPFAGIGLKFGPRNIPPISPERPLLQTSPASAITDTLSDEMAFFKGSSAEFTVADKSQLDEALASLSHAVKEIADINDIIKMFKKLKRTMREVGIEMNMHNIWFAAFYNSLFENPLFNLLNYGALSRGMTGGRDDANSFFMASLGVNGIRPLDALVKLLDNCPDPAKMDTEQVSKTAGSLLTHLGNVMKAIQYYFKDKPDAKTTEQFRNIFNNYLDKLRDSKNPNVRIFYFAICAKFFGFLIGHTKYYPGDNVLAELMAIYLSLHLLPEHVLNAFRIEDEGILDKIKEASKKYASNNPAERIEGLLLLDFLIINGYIDIDSTTFSDQMDVILNRVGTLNEQLTGKDLIDDDYLISLKTILVCLDIMFRVSSKGTAKIFPLAPDTVRAIIVNYERVPPNKRQELNIGAILNPEQLLDAGLDPDRYNFEYRTMFLEIANKLFSKQISSLFNSKPEKYYSKLKKALNEIATSFDAQYLQNLLPLIFFIKTPSESKEILKILTKIIDPLFKKYDATFTGVQMDFIKTLAGYLEELDNSLQGNTNLPQWLGPDFNDRIAAPLAQKMGKFSDLKSIYSRCISMGLRNFLEKIYDFLFLEIPSENDALPQEEKAPKRRQRPRHGKHYRSGRHYTRRMPHKSTKPKTTFSVQESLPVGATFSPYTGRFRWTPDEEQAGKGHLITFSKMCSEELVDTRQVLIVVLGKEQGLIAIKQPETDVEVIKAKTGEELSFKANSLFRKRPIQMTSEAKVQEAARGALGTAATLMALLGVFGFVAQGCVVGYEPYQKPGVADAGRDAADTGADADRDAADTGADAGPDATETGIDADTGPDAQLPINHPPVANAGQDQTVDEGTIVTLDGTQSRDPDPEDQGRLTYLWEQIAGPRVAIQNADQAIASFPAPEVHEDTVLSFSLTISDGRGGEDTDTVMVTIRHVNKPPVAAAQADQEEVYEGEDVALDGSQSTDPDRGDEITFRWTQIENGAPMAVINNPDHAMASFTAPDMPDGDEATLVFELTVTDRGGRTDTARVEVRVSSDTIVAPLDVNVNAINDPVTLFNNSNLNGDSHLSTDAQFVIANNAGYEYEENWSWQLSAEDRDKILQNGLNYVYNGVNHSVKLSGQNPDGRTRAVRFNILSDGEQGQPHRVIITAEQIRQLAQENGLDLNTINILFENMEPEEPIILTGFQRYFAIAVSPQPVPAPSQVGSWWENDSSPDIEELDISPRPDGISINARLTSGGGKFVRIRIIPILKTENNIAPRATVTGSPELSPQFPLGNVNDGDFATAWVTGESLPVWLRLTWLEDRLVWKLRGFDLPALDEQITECTVTIYDATNPGYTVSIPMNNWANDGPPNYSTRRFEAIPTREIRLDIAEVLFPPDRSPNPGVVEFQIFEALSRANFIANGLSQLPLNVIGNTAFIIQLLDGTGETLSIPIMGADPAVLSGTILDLPAIIQQVNPSFSLRDVRSSNIVIPDDLLPVAPGQVFNATLDINGVYAETGDRLEYSATDPDLTPECYTEIIRHLPPVNEMTPLDTIDGIPVYGIQAPANLISDDGLHFVIGGSKLSAFHINGAIYVPHPDIALGKLRFNNDRLLRAIDNRKRIITEHELHEIKGYNHKDAVLTEFENSINGLNYADIATILLSVLINNNIETIDLTFHRIFIAELLKQGIPLSFGTYREILKEMLDTSIPQGEFDSVILLYNNMVITHMGGRKIYSDGIRLDINEDKLTDEPGYNDLANAISSQTHTGNILIGLDRFIITNSTLSDAVTIDTEYLKRFVYYAKQLGPNIKLFGITPSPEDDIVIQQLTSLLRGHIPNISIIHNVDFANLETCLTNAGITDLASSVSILSEEAIKSIGSYGNLKIVAPILTDCNRVSAVWQEFRIAILGIQKSKSEFLEMVITVARELLQDMVNKKQITENDMQRIIEEIRQRGIGFIPVYFDPIQYYRSIQTQRALLTAA